MRHLFVATLVAIALTTAVPTVSAADSTFPSIFLRGDRLEVGIHPAGSFGSSTNAPDGFAKPGAKLGFVYKREGNGGTSGDYLVHGTPMEGWLVKWENEAGAGTTLSNAGLMQNKFDIPVDGMVNTTFDNNLSAMWSGTAAAGSDRLRILQTVTFDKTNGLLVVAVVMTNTGSSTLRKLRYLRWAYPDPEAVLDPKGSATNSIPFMPPASGRPAIPSGNLDKALVVARGDSFGYKLGLGAVDARAVAVHHDVLDPDDVIAKAAEPRNQAGKQAIMLAYQLADLAAGQSVSLNYAYLVEIGDADAALDYLKQLTIVQPSGIASGTNVLFQVRTSGETPSQVEFRIPGAPYSIDNTVSATGTFETTFNSLTVMNGQRTLTAIATYPDGSTITRSSSVDISNAGPAIDFASPTPAEGSEVSGTGLAVRVTGGQQATIAFFRGDTPLPANANDPQQAAFNVDGLPIGVPVLLRAVAWANGSHTVITRSVIPSLPTAATPVVLAAPTIALSSPSITRYTPVCPGTSEGLERLRAALAGRPRSEIRAFTWDAPSGAFVEYPGLPTGGLSPAQAWFIASRRELGLDFSGSSVALPWTLTLHPGWNFVGMLPGNNLGALRTSYVLSTLQLLDAQGATISGAPRTAAIGEGAYHWNGSAYAVVTTMACGHGYWIQNRSGGPLTLRAPLMSDPLPVDMGKSATASTGTDGQQPPPPPASAPADDAKGGCGSGSMIGLLVLAAALMLRLQRSRA